MSYNKNLTKMAANIKALRQTTEELKELAGDFPAVAKNADRILANVRMLEIDITDVIDVS